MVIGEWLVGKDVEGTGSGLFQALPQHLPQWTEENHENKSGYPLSGQRFEAETSRIRKRSVNHLTTRFGTRHCPEVVLSTAHPHDVSPIYISVFQMGISQKIF
jgi:hypothetical protein